MSTPDVLEMETSPETANYRKSRLEIWTQLHQKRDDYRASALKHGATKAQAEEAAGRDTRSENTRGIIPGWAANQNPGGFPGRATSPGKISNGV